MRTGTSDRTQTGRLSGRGAPLTFGQHADAAVRPGSRSHPGLATLIRQSDGVGRLEERGADGPNAPALRSGVRLPDTQHGGVRSAQRLRAASLRVNR